MKISQLDETKTQRANRAVNHSVVLFVWNKRQSLLTLLAAIQLRTVSPGVQLVVNSLVISFFPCRQLGPSGEIRTEAEEWHELSGYPSRVVGS